MIKIFNIILSYIYIINNSIIYCDFESKVLGMPTPFGMFFQESGNYFNSMVNSIHELILTLIIAIFLLVTWLLFFTIYIGKENKYKDYVKKNKYYKFALFSLISYNKSLYLFIRLVENFILIIYIIYCIFYFQLYTIKEVYKKFYFIDITKDIFYNLNFEDLKKENKNFFNLLISDIKILGKNSFFFDFYLNKNIFKYSNNQFFFFFKFFYKICFLFESIYHDSYNNEIDFLRKFYLNNNYNYNFNSDIGLESLWSSIPSFFLFLISIPSIFILFYIRNVTDLVPDLTITVIGHQWWWEYQYNDISFSVNMLENIKQNNKIDYNFINKINICEEKIFNYLKPFNNKILNNENLYNLSNKYLKNCNFFIDYLNINNEIKLNLYNKLIEKNQHKICEIKLESYMIPESELKKTGLRLLEVDNRLIVPINKVIRFLITSNDVLHSWSLPSLGIKMDACPGRINEVITIVNKKGIYYGQCSELCGYHHGFMPIVLESVDINDFNLFIKKFN